MRIVQVVENLQVGGLERMALDLAIAQKAGGHTAFIYCLFEPGDLAMEAEACGVSVRAFHKPLGFHAKTALRMMQQMKQDRIDVVHCHNPGVHHYGAVAGWLAGAKAIINTRHGPKISTGGNYQERWFKLVYPLTDHVVYVSAQARQYLTRERGLPEARSSVLYNGISLEKFSSHRAHPASVLPRLRLGSIGRMVPAKGHLVLLEAFAEVAPKLPHAELRIVGGGLLMNDLRAKIESLGLEGRASLEPLSPNTAAIFENLDLFVLSSLSEGLPLVILEAMAAGLPIVSSRIGGVPEVAPEGTVAWYATPGNAHELAERILEAAADPHELERRGAAARLLASGRYGLQHMAANYLELYERILRSKSK